MPRRHREINPYDAYHVCSRSNNRINFGLPVEKLWGIFSNYLFFISHAYEVKIHAFVLMSNHFHLQISSPKENLSHALNYFLRETSKEINRRRNTINHVYGGRVFISSIKTPLYYYYSYKYLYQNPVRAGIVSHPIDYPWSSLRGIYGLSSLDFPVFDNQHGLDSLIPEAMEDQIELLGEKLSDDQNELITKGLKRRIFSVPKKKIRYFSHT